jgi:homoserine/homoserine lactone efflux protein
MNESTLLYVAMVVVTVASPGPGVLMTLDNAIARGWCAAMQGVFGLALGAAVMAGLSSAGAGLLVSSSPTLFVALKYGGALYLVYLACKAWRRQPLAPPGDAPLPRNGLGGLLLRGALLQTSNPKSLLFFLSVLPQVVVGAHGDTGWPLARTAAAIGIYCTALLLIHGVYACAAARARVWLARPSAAKVLSRISAGIYVGFGVAMLVPVGPFVPVLTFMWELQ